jgi:hypothetical protein
MELNCQEFIANIQTSEVRVRGLATSSVYSLVNGFGKKENICISRESVFLDLV